MKKIILLSIFIISVFNLHSQSSTDIVIGKIDSLNSKILDEERKIWVHVPGGNSSVVYGKKSYPVLYLLDGDAHFYSVVGMMRQMSSVNGNTSIPKMIVVGIPNTNRTRDLTPSKGVYGHPYTDSTMVDVSGGGDNFISFIEKELIPYIDSNYPTEPYRMFVGHSFGGLTVLNTLIHHPELFNSYVSLDPSMWWSDRLLLEQIKNTTFDEKYNNKSLYVAIANTMEAGMDTTTAKNDTSIGTDHIRSILEMDALLKSKANKHLLYKGSYFHDEDHGSVPLIAEYDAFKFIFDFYELKLDMDDYLDTDSDVMDKVKNHYKNLSEQFGKELKPDEEVVNELGYLMIRREEYDKAEEFFKLNVLNYPDSFNVFDSLGDFYVEVGKKRKAIKNYKKSLELNKDSYSKEKLLELEKE